jgi:hypothetical protein
LTQDELLDKDKLFADVQQIPANMHDPPIPQPLPILQWLHHQHQSRRLPQAKGRQLARLRGLTMEWTRWSKSCSSSRIANSGGHPTGHASTTTNYIGNPPPNIGADLPGFVPSPADFLLHVVFGDHPHDNDGSHLDGDILQDRLWQSWYHRIIQIAPSQYAVPKGAVGKRFLTVLTHELAQVQAREWNSERLLIFVAVLLQKSAGVRQSKDICLRLSRRMDLWAHGSFTALVDHTEAKAGNNLQA